jgi:hypothetical protein
MVGQDSGVRTGGSGRKARYGGLGARCWGSALILMTALACHAARANAPSDDIPESGLRLTVRIFDYAGIESRTLQGASHRAARVLRKAGLATDWQYCDAVHGHMPETCNQPLQPVVR